MQGHVQVKVNETHIYAQLHVLHLRDKYTLNNRYDKHWM